MSEEETLNVWMPIALGILLVFGLMTFKSCEEIKYKISGVQVEAHVNGVQNYTGRRGSKSREVKYSFQPAEGDRVRGVSRVPIDWTPSGPSNTVNVTYLKGDPETNAATIDRSSTPIFIMLATLLALLFAGWKFNQNLNSEMGK